MGLPAKKTKVEFRPTKGARFGEKEARVIGRRLMQLAQGGDITGVTAERVLEDAKNPKSPLHCFFEWDNKKAAVQYRIVQARYLLRHISIRFKEGDREIETRAFHAVYDEEKENRIYVPMTVVFSTPDYKEQIVETARREMENWISRYQQYTTLRIPVAHARKILKILSGKA